LATETPLKKVVDEGIIQSLIMTARDHKLEVLVWRFVGESKFIAPVKIEAVNKVRGEFTIHPSNGSESDVQAILASRSYIDLYVPESALLFRCEIKRTDAPQRYVLQFPDFVAQAERRKFLRLNVYREGQVRINFSKTINGTRPVSQHFAKACVDISAGGMSFFVSRTEAKFFQIHDPIRQIELIVGDELRVKINAEVALIKEVEPDQHNKLTYKVWRISCRFSQVDEVTRKYLERYIFQRLNDEVHAING
jgi:hypothetical protein